MPIDLILTQNFRKPPLADEQPPCYPPIPSSHCLPVAATISSLVANQQVPKKIKQRDTKERVGPAQKIASSHLDDISLNSNMTVGNDLSLFIIPNVLQKESTELCQGELPLLFPKQFISMYTPRAAVVERFFAEGILDEINHETEEFLRGIKFSSNDDLLLPH